MAKFFVGQRVRLVVARRQENLGAEGAVTHLGDWGFGDELPNGFTAGGPREVMVMFDRPMHCGLWIVNHCGTLSSALEPILPSGATPSDYSLAELMDKCRAGEGVAA